MTKYRNRKTLCSQMHWHASKKEAYRCTELTLLERAGKIKLLKQQPIFPIQGKFRFGKEAVRAIDYIADFSYFDNEKKMFVVEDTKGFKTKDYLIKVKMLKKIMQDREDFLFIES